MIEAELKARLTEPEAVRARLAGRATVEKAIYRDTYYDNPAGQLAREGRELRLRTVETHDPKTHDPKTHFLTYKEKAVDEASGSKPEHETVVGERCAVARTLEGLGYAPSIELTKHCENYRFAADGRDFLATVVQVPEIEGTFLEVETQAPEHDLPAALASVRSLMGELGISESQLTTELYTERVKAARPI